MKRENLPHTKQYVDQSRRRSLGMPPTDTSFSLIREIRQMDERSLMNWLEKTIPLLINKQEICDFSQVGSVTKAIDMVNAAADCGGNIDMLLNESRKRDGGRYEDFELNWWLMDHDRHNQPVGVDTTGIYAIDLPSELVAMCVFGDPLLLTQCSPYIQELTEKVSMIGGDNRYVRTLLYTAELGVRMHEHLKKYQGLDKWIDSPPKYRSLIGEIDYAAEFLRKKGKFDDRFHRAWTAIDVEMQLFNSTKGQGKDLDQPDIHYYHQLLSYAPGAVELLEQEPWLALEIFDECEKLFASDNLNCHKVAVAWLRFANLVQEDVL